MEFHVLTLRFFPVNILTDPDVILWHDSGPHLQCVWTIRTISEELSKIWFFFFFISPMMRGWDLLIDRLWTN